MGDAIRLDNDPISRARSWVEQGSDIVHVVDLDAAAHRDYRNRAIIDTMIKSLPVPVQVAGGVRSAGEARRLIDAGAHRVVMGTAAIEDQNMVWELCGDHPGKIVVSIDVRADGEIAIRGWTVNSGRYLDDVLLEMSDAGVTSFLVAEAGRNALVEPPNLDMLSTALALVDDDVIAAGGVRHLDDLRDLTALESDGKRLNGVIVGREVTHGRFTFDQAKAVLAEQRDTVIGTHPEQPPRDEPDAAALAAAERYEKLASELEQAAAQSRTAARRLLAGETARAHTHGMATIGHLARARHLVEEQAIDLASHSTE